MISALRDLALTSVKLVEERLRLLGAELQEEKWRAIEAVLWLAIALVLGALSLLVASLAVVLTVWSDPQARILGLVGLPFSACASARSGKACRSPTPSPNSRGTGNG
ncbi:MAG: phage holin family protein [Verrucomicrobia bacterium]|nr:phage holin family protein [Verrucomicrobiota bacterium]